MITLKAHAKINLTLDVTGTLDNGYHSLQMIMQSVSLSDTLTISPSNSGLHFSSNNSRMPVNENNLVVKAARLFLDTYNVDNNIDLYLKKMIPISAGLAGGSADAAAVLLGLDKYFDCNIPLSELQQLGLKLGADVPFCLQGGTALCEGIGEKITSLSDLPNCYILIVKPPQSMPTPKAFSLYDSFDGIIPEVNNISAIKAIANNDLDSLCLYLANKIQPITEKEHPFVSVLRTILSQNGAKAAIMSGSGTSVYGIFDSRIIAEKCQKKLPKNIISYITSPVPVGISFIE